MDELRTDGDAHVPINLLEERLTVEQRTVLALE
jgi:hypothetical protein